MNSLSGYGGSALGTNHAIYDHFESVLFENGFNSERREVYLAVWCIYDLKWERQKGRQGQGKFHPS